MKIGETLARRCIKMGLLSALGFVSVSCSGESDAPREVTVAASDGLQDYDLTCTAGDSVSFSSVAEGDTLSVNVSNDSGVDLGEWVIPSISNAFARLNGFKSPTELKEARPDTVITLDSCDIEVAASSI